MPAVRPIRRFPDFRGFRASRSARIAGLAAAILLLAACQPGQDPGSGQPSGPMYSCIGKAGYAQSWDEILAEIERNPPDCETRKPADEARAPLGGTAGLPSHPRPLVDTVPIHVYMMDGQCRFLGDFRDSVALPRNGSQPHAFPLRMMEDPAGSPLPTGEYYVNVEYEYPDGSKDTSYQKYGIIRDPCTP